jgi:hypothetical protein
MTNDRSSKDAFLLLLNQLKTQSSLVQVVASVKRLPVCNIWGRITEVSADRFTTRGRGCEMEFDISGAATFEVFRAADMPVVPIRFRGGSSLRPEWRIGWRNGDVIMLGEETPPSP